VAAASARGWCIFDPSLMFPGRLEEAFDWFTRLVFLAAKEVRGRKLFACDELQNFVPSRELPQWFAAVLQTGRIYELDAAYIAIAPNMCHQQLRAHASECVAFNTSESGAVDLLTAEWGLTARSCAGCRSSTSSPGSAPAARSTALSSRSPHRRKMDLADVWIIPDGFVRCDQGQILHSGSCHDHHVERIPMKTPG
jgi:hypothetical protein